jgi:nitrogenase molybdenum-iron protein alpha/beta subunit
MWDVNQVNDLIDLLKECGANHVSVWGRNGGLSEIVQGAGTKINLVVSASAVSAAKILQKKYGTPYLVGYPIGKTQVELWKKKLTKILQNQEMPEKRECEAVEATGMSGCKKICAKKYEKRALIVAEQISANAIRECLKSEFLYEKVDVASFFMMDSVSMEDGDQKLPDEDALVEMMGESGKYDLVICDPLIYPLLPYKPKRTMPYPHTAISGRIFWSRSANFFGEKGTEYIREQIGDKNA